MQELSKDENDLLLMGILLSTQFDKEKTCRGKRKHTFFNYSFQAEHICAGALRYIYDIGQKALKNLKKHLHENGPVPRRHGNLGRRPCHSMQFSDVSRCVQFLKLYAEEFGIPHPAPLHGRDSMPPVYLLASKTIQAIRVD